MRRRITQIAVRQRPGALFVRVRSRRIDGAVSVTWRWTWLGWLLRWALPEPTVEVTRSRELVLGGINKKETTDKEERP